MIDNKKAANFSDRLRQAMVDTGKNQTDLANETGLDKSLISRYVAGAHEPKTDTIYKLAQVLNVSERWLSGYDVPMERPVMPYENDEIAELVHRWKNDNIFRAVVKSINDLDYKKLSSIALMLDAFRQ